MPTLLSKALQLLTGDDTTPTTDWLRMPKQRAFKKYTERDLINLESEIGSALFGPVPKGHRREFFCLDKTTWIWHEEWLDKDDLQTATTRYEVQEKGILKVQSGPRYSYLEGEELANFAAAVTLYYEKVAREVYKIDPDSGLPLQ